MRRSFAIAALCLLGACQSPTTPAQTVFALEAGYDAAVNVAIVYASLPRCAPPPAPVLCSDAAVVRQTNDAAHKAWRAIRAAEDAARAAKPDASATAQAIAAAQVSLAALRSLTDNMKVN